MRSLISTNLKPFAVANPTLEIVVNNVNGKHPNVKGEYRTGWDKVVGVKNMEVNEIMNQIVRLNDSSGRKLTKFTKPVYPEQMSVQGRWTPGLDLGVEEFTIKEVNHVKH